MRSSGFDIGDSIGNGVENIFKICGRTTTIGTGISITALACKILGIGASSSYASVLTTIAFCGTILAAGGIVAILALGIFFADGMRR